MGLFEAANGGTLFLDELPSLSPALQAKVLTVIEDHKIRRLGSQKPIVVDVRLIAGQRIKVFNIMVACRKKFREDLYHRLDLYRIRIPPLRERNGDILKLAELVIQRLCQRHRMTPKKITADGQTRLARLLRGRATSANWPTNWNAPLFLRKADELNFTHLKVGSQSPTAPTRSDEWLNDGFVFPPEGFKLEEAINRLIQQALKQSKDNVSAAARLLRCFALIMCVIASKAAKDSKNAGE